MKIISKRTTSNGEPTFTLTKLPAPNQRNAYQLEEHGQTWEVTLKQTLKGYQMELYICNKFTTIFLSNVEIIVTL